MARWKGQVRRLKDSPWTRGAWTRVTLKFQDLTQPNWGKQLEKTFNDVTKLTFTPGSTDPDFDFKVDDVEFVK